MGSQNTTKGVPWHRRILDAASGVLVSDINEWYYDGGENDSIYTSHLVEHDEVHPNADSLDQDDALARLTPRSNPVLDYFREQKTRIV